MHLHPADTMRRGTAGHMTGGARGWNGGLGVGGWGGGSRDVSVTTWRAVGYATDNTADKRHGSYLLSKPDQRPRALWNCSLGLCPASCRHTPYLWDECAVVMSFHYKRRRVGVETGVGKATQYVCMKAIRLA